MGEHWLGYINNFQVHFDTLFTMWFAMAVLIVFALIATRKLEVIPSKTQAVAESIVKFFMGNLSEVKDGNKHVPIVASLFLFIVTANLMGQLPLRLIHLKQGELASPTNDINLTAALAVIVLMYYLFYGFKEKGFRYIYHGFSVTGIITTLVDILEMITRPLSLAIRLFANILAGEILVAVVLGLCAFAAPLPVMLFELLVAFIQAFVFMMLTIAYITSAVNNEH